MKWYKLLSNAFDSIEKKKARGLGLNKTKTLRGLEKFIKLKTYEF